MKDVKWIGRYNLSTRIYKIEWQIEWYKNQMYRIKK